jgi:predicted SnoaL-like aldol condensation-catalyzing enzyme
MKVHKMATTTEQSNKALVLEAFDTLFNKRDYKAAERYRSSNYIQHSAHIPPGRDGLFNLIRGAPATLRYEPGAIVAEGDYVIVHGRFSNTGMPRNWIVADVVRVGCCRNTRLKQRRYMPSTLTAVIFRQRPEHSSIFSRCDSPVGLRPSKMALTAIVVSSATSSCSILTRCDRRLFCCRRGAAGRAYARPALWWDLDYSGDCWWGSGFFAYLPVGPKSCMH